MDFSTYKGLFKFVAFPKNCHFLVVSQPVVAITN